MILPYDNTGDGRIRSRAAKPTARAIRAQLTNDEFQELLEFLHGTITGFIPVGTKLNELRGPEFVRAATEMPATTIISRQ